VQSVLGPIFHFVSDLDGDAKRTGVKRATLGEKGSKDSMTLCRCMGKKGRLLRCLRRSCRGKNGRDQQQQGKERKMRKEEKETNHTNKKKKRFELITYKAGNTTGGGWFRNGLGREMLVSSQATTALESSRNEGGKYEEGETF